MRVKGTLELEFDDAGVAERLYRSLRVDDDGYLSQKLEGARIVVTVEADTPGSVAQTLDDYLSCMSAAQRSITSVSRLRPGP